MADSYLFFFSVPPQFTNTERNSEILAREGTNVTLSCTVTGHPHPMVTWHREDGQPFLAGQAHKDHHRQ